MKPPGTGNSTCCKTQGDWSCRILKAFIIVSLCGDKVHSGNLLTRNDVHIENYQVDRTSMARKCPDKLQPRYEVLRKQTPSSASNWPPSQIVSDLDYLLHMPYTSMHMLTIYFGKQMRRVLLLHSNSTRDSI